MKKAAVIGFTAAAITATVGMRRAFRPLPAQPLPGEIRRIDGEDIHFIEAGSGPAVVLIHGFAASSFTWRDVLPELSERHRVVALDLPGFGFSDRNTALDYSLGAHARRTKRLMDSLGIGHAVVVGHSMGGAVAQRLALQYPGSVEALVLAASVDASARAPWEQHAAVHPLLFRLLDIGLHSPVLVRFGSRRTVLDIAADPSYATPEVIDGYARPVLVPGTAAALARLVAGTAAEPPADLSQLSVPTLVISGERDRSVPVSVGEGLETKIAGARHVVVPGIGHLTAEERPELFLAELTAFLSGLEGAGVAASSAASQ